MFVTFINAIDDNYLYTKAALVHTLLTRLGKFAQENRIKLDPSAKPLLLMILKISYF